MGARHAIGRSVVACDRQDGLATLDLLLSEGRRLDLIATDDAHFTDPDQFGGVPYIYAFVEIVGGGVLLASAVGLFFPRYPQNVQISEVV